MSNIQDIKNKINNLIASGNEMAGTNHATLTEVIEELKLGYGSGQGIEVNGKLWNMVLSGDYTCLSAFDYGIVTSNTTGLGEKGLAVCGLSDVTLTEATSIPNYFAAENRQISRLLAPKATTIGKEAFKNCTKLSKVEFSEGLTTIGEYAFYNAPISAINLENTTSIGKNAFNGCNNLEKIIAPLLKIVNSNSFNTSSIKIAYFPVLEKIEGSYGFNWSGNGVNNFIFPGPTLITTTSSSFLGYGTPSTSSHPNIYVNDDLVDQYKAATNWSKYANYIFPVSTLPEDIKAEIGME